jgi:excinuclease UvrABC helicase subunit UvrB
MSGYYLVYKYQRRQVRLEMKAFLRNNDTIGNASIVHFSFNLKEGEVSANEFEWMNDHEFSFKGELYDIIRSTTEGDILRVDCVNDETETLLVKEFESIFKKEGGNPVKGNAALIQLAHSVYLEPIQLIAINSPNYNTVTYTGWILHPFDSYLQDITVPPPQLV